MAQSWHDAHLKSGAPNAIANSKYSGRLKHYSLKKSQESLLQSMCLLKASANTKSGLRYWDEFQSRRNQRTNTKEKQGGGLSIDQYITELRM